VRPLGIVIVDPGGEDRASLADREEQCLVEQLVAHAAIEALDEPVLRRLAGGDVMPLDPSIAGPGKHRIRGKLGAIVADDHLRRASLGNQIDQLTDHPPARDRRVDHCSQAFARHVIDDVEHPETTAGGKLVVNEVQAPALVGERQHRRGGPRANGAPSALPAPDRQPFFAIEPLSPLAVDRDAVAAEQDVQPPIAEPPALLRQLA